MDLHYLRELREAVLKKDSKKLLESEMMKKTELDIIKKSDMTIVVSLEEASLLLKEDTAINCSVIPPLQIPINETPTYSERKDLLFLGGFQHKPNIDSLENLISDIFPKILKKIPDVRLYVIGSNPSEEIIDLCKDVSNVEFLGYVKNIDPYLNKCRLLLAPLRYGAGVKGKITQSMAHGLVTITTKIGSEGISNKNNEVLLIAKNDEEFIEKTITTYNNKEIWTKISFLHFLNFEERLCQMHLIFFWQIDKKFHFLYRLSPFLFQTNHFDFALIVIPKWKYTFEALQF